MRSSLLLVAIALSAGCTIKRQRIPFADPAFADADYRVLGKTNHQECGTYVFGVDWKHAFKNQSGLRPGPGAGANAEERRALYHALEKMPEATHLLAHRSHTTINGLAAFGHPLFGKRCAEVDARGVRIQEQPLPQD